MIFVVEKCISPIPESITGSDNRFVEINANELSFVASQSVLIGGQRRQVKKIMFYKPSWIKRNYLEPMAKLITSGIVGLNCCYKKGASIVQHIMLP